MDKLKELAQLFENIEVDETQANAIKEFWSLLQESIKDQVEAEYQQEIETLNEELEEAKKGSGSSDEARLAFEAFEADAKKAFDAFAEDAEKAADRMVEDLKEEHAKQLAEALDKLYEDIEARVTEDFKSSKEFVALTNVIKAVNTVVGTDNTKSLLEEIEALKQENESLKNNNITLSKKDVIANLVEGFSEEHKKTMIEFMEGAKTEDEIYERFNAIASVIEGSSSEGMTPEERKNKKFKRKKEEKEKENINEETSALIGQAPIEEGSEIVNEHVELLGTNIPGFSKVQQQGLAWLIHRRQAH